MTKSKHNNKRQGKILSDKPAAIKLREDRRKRTPEERLTEKINSQRRAAMRLARNILNKSAWSLLEHAKQEFITTAVETRIRGAYEMAIRVRNDKLSVCYEARKATADILAQNPHLFVWTTEFGKLDESLPSELLEADLDEERG